MLEDKNTDKRNNVCRGMAMSNIVGCQKAVLMGKGRRDQEVRETGQTQIRKGHMGRAKKPR